MMAAGGAAYGGVAPYAGAWIEIVDSRINFNWPLVAPYAGAWIEILGHFQWGEPAMSHLTQVRGLKLLTLTSKTN